MKRPAVERCTLAVSAIVLFALCGCGGDSKPATTTDVAPACADGKTSFDSTFAAIQQVIFERHGCTQQVCHGSAAQGGLDLSPAVA